MGKTRPSDRPILFDSLIAVKLPQALKAPVMEEATRMGRSVSWIMRECLIKRYRMEAHADQSLVKKRTLGKKQTTLGKKQTRAKTKTI